MSKALYFIVLLAMCCLSVVQAEELTAIVQAKVSVETEKAKALAADPGIVKAVKDFNANKPAQLRTMTQAKWEAVKPDDPVVVALSTNGAAQFLKTHIDDVVSEAFISCADGTKVALLSKTTNWSHIGIRKHEDPMQGKIWQGTMERDLSANVLQLQIAVPVLDGGKPIGSLVIGLKVRELGNRRAASN